METSVGILDSRNISFGYGGSNWLIRVDVLFAFCVLADYLVGLSISELGAKKYSFGVSILSLGDTEPFSASLSSKSSVAWFLALVPLGETLVLL